MGPGSMHPGHCSKAARVGSRIGGATRCGAAGMVDQSGTGDFAPGISFRVASVSPYPRFMSTSRPRRPRYCNGAARLLRCSADSIHTSCDDRQGHPAFPRRIARHADAWTSAVWSVLRSHVNSGARCRPALPACDRHGLSVSARSTPAVHAAATRAAVRRSCAAEAPRRRLGDWR